MPEFPLSFLQISVVVIRLDLSQYFSIVTIGDFVPKGPKLAPIVKRK